MQKQHKHHTASAVPAGSLVAEAEGRHRYQGAGGVCGGPARAPPHGPGPARRRAWPQRRHWNLSTHHSASQSSVLRPLPCCGRPSPRSPRPTLQGRGRPECHEQTQRAPGNRPLPWLPAGCGCRTLTADEGVKAPLDSETLPPESHLLSNSVRLALQPAARLLRSETGL